LRRAASRNTFPSPHGHARKIQPSLRDFHPIMHCFRALEAPGYCQMPLLGFSLITPFYDPKRRSKATGLSCRPRVFQENAEVVVGKCRS